MFETLRAEWIKIVKNVRLTSALVWIFPVATATVLLVGILINWASGGFAGYMSRSMWTNDLVAIWGAVNRFPGNVFGRLLPLAFLAVIFAGEYQHGTWRVIVPRSNRVRLVLAKLGAGILAICSSLALTSIIIVLLQAIGHTSLGVPYAPELAMPVVSQAIQNYLLEVLIAFLSLLLLGAFAAVSAFITRSILGSLLLTFGFSIAELLSLGVLAVFSVWFDRPGIMNGYRYMPSYNLENLRAWVVDGHGWTEVPFNVAIEASMIESLLFVGLWIALVLGWAISIFRKQDLTD